MLEHFETFIRLRTPRGVTTSRHGQAYTVEDVALNMIRARISWYSAGLQPWPGLRRRVSEMRSAAEFRDYMHAVLDRLDRGLPVGVPDSGALRTEILRAV